MMGYGRKPNDPKQAILAKAIEILGTSSDGAVTLNQVKKLIAERDDSLCLELEAFDDRHYKKLSEGSADIDLAAQSAALRSRGRRARSGTAVGTGQIRQRRQNSIDDRQYAVPD